MASRASLRFPTGPGIRPCDEAAVSLYAVRRDAVRTGHSAAGLADVAAQVGKANPVAVHRVGG